MMMMMMINEDEDEADEADDDDDDEDDQQREPAVSLCTSDPEPKMPHGRDKSFYQRHCT